MLWALIRLGSAVFVYYTKLETNLSSVMLIDKLLVHTALSSLIRFVHLDGSTQRRSESIINYQICIVYGSSARVHSNVFRT